MQLAPHISIVSDNATPELARLMSSVQPLRLARVCAKPMETFTRIHLAANGENKKGWPSTGFWEDASRHTDATASESGVVIEVKKGGARQRLFGGTIVPDEKEALTIPISPNAYGHTAKEFPGLFLLKTKKGAYLVRQLHQFSHKTPRLVQRVKGEKRGGLTDRKLGRGVF